jgi:hypothetical protein
MWHFSLLFNAGQNFFAKRQTIGAFEKIIIFQRLDRKLWK